MFQRYEEGGLDDSRDILDKFFFALSEDMQMLFGGVFVVGEGDDEDGEEGGKVEDAIGHE